MPSMETIKRLCADRPPSGTEQNTQNANPKGSKPSLANSRVTFLGSMTHNSNAGSEAQTANTEDTVYTNSEDLTP